MSKSIIESKVWAATVGSGAGGVTTSFLLWVLGVVFWHASPAATDAVAAAAAVPAPVAALAGVVLGVGGTFLGGYLAPHTDRPDLAVAAAPAAPAAPTVETVEPPAVAEPTAPPA